jgi:hypothetical protein
MDLDVKPEPTPEEEAALRAALAKLRSSQSEDSRNEWWRQGVEENLDAADADPS